MMVLRDYTTSQSWVEDHYESVWIPEQIIPAYGIEQHLKKIEYAGQSVEFAYTPNTFNPKSSYINTFLVSQTKLLSTITTKSGTTTLKTFGFGYTTDKRLNAVNESAADNTKLNSTVINWGAESAGVTKVDMGNNPDPNLGQNKGFVCTGDVDGDGYPDRIEMWPGNSSELGHIIVYLYDKNTQKFKSDGTSIPIPYYDPNIYQPKIVVSDINNDGVDEIILVNGGRVHTYNYQFGALTVDVNGVSLNSDVLYHANRSFDILSADVNHDNYNDIVLVFNNYRGGGAQLYPGYIVFPGSANGLTDKTVSTEYFVNDNTYNRYQLGDFNADGKMDILGLPGNGGTNENLTDNLLTVVSKGTWGNMTNNTLRNFTGDFNGDGLSDLLVESSTHSWSILENAGGFDNVPVVKNQTFTGTELYTLDFNGDGLVDVVTGEVITRDSSYIDYSNYGQDGYPLETISVFDHVNWNFYKNLGGTFNSTPDYVQTSYYQISALKGFVTDINGDGVADLVLPTTYNNYIALTLPNATRRNMVTGITNGMGQTNSFAYKNFSNYDQRATTAPLRNVKAPLNIVDTETDPDGFVTAYTFDSPKMHTQGKGFLGFSTITATNTVKNVKIKSDYEIEPTYFGVNLKTQTITTANDLAVSSSAQTNGIKIIDAARKRYIPIVTAQTSTDALKGISQTATADYSLYPASMTQSMTSGDLTTTTVTTYTGPGITPYLPATVITTRTQNGTAIKTTNYGYTFDNTNQYKVTQNSETTDLGDINQVITTHTYDTWGHPQTVSVAANGKIRSSTVSYVTVGNGTPSGRFVASKTNVLNETTTYTWDESRGLLTSETTRVNGKDRITSYTYNAWGQLVETIYPDGVRKANVLQWATTNNAKYSSYSETSGSAPVTVWYDALGREIQKDTYGLKNNKISVYTEYRTSDGKTDRVSEPVFDGDTKTWAATYGYDPDYGMVTSVVTPLGTTSTVYDKLTTTVTSPEGTQSITTNAAGQTLTSTVNDKKVTYTYYPSGLTHTSTPEGGLPVQMVYDLQGNRSNLTDPDGGIVETVYDGFGELITEQQKVHNATDYVTTTNTYYDNGLMNYITRGVGTTLEKTTYTYDPDNRVSTIEIAGKNKQTFTYDDFDRVNKITEDLTANGVTRTYITAKEYDFFGRIKKETFPSGYYTVNSYDNYSNLIEIKDNVRSIWKADAENALGQATSIYKGGIKTNYVYDPISHLKTSIKATGIVDYTYGYDSKNNLSWRADNLITQYNPTSQSESFTYDTQNRLTNWNVIRSGTTTYNSIGFDGNGNITQKSDLGAFTLNYGGKNPDGTTTGRPDGSLIGPHALSTISGVPTSFPQVELPNYPTAALSVTYTDFKKIATLTEKNRYYELTYGVDDQRRMSVYKEGGVTKLTRYYLGDYEEEISANNKVRKIHYLSGAILIQNEGKQDSLLYTYSDAQGSLIALTDADGNLVRRYAYDPWGKRRDADNWNAKDNGVNLIVNRGYTGHEHLDAFGIINMNGRVYDPLTAQFFSPDPYLQAPGDWLNYNRYTYCSGNPFRYTDPSGDLQLGPFYISLNIGWSPQGGLSLGISAGVGLEGGLYAGFSLNYGFKNNNFSASLNAGAGGGYAYAGYDTKGGWIGGAGFAAPSAFSVWSPVSFSTNLTTVGIGYSENGGWSGNYSALNISGEGASFDPSIGASATMKFGTEVVYSDLSNDVTSRKNSCFQSQKEMNDYLKSVGQGAGINGVESVDYENTVFPVKGDTRDADGIIHTKNGGIAGAVTYLHYHGFSVTGSVFMSPHLSLGGFDVSYNHELIHLYHYNKYSGGKLINEKLKSYSENVAHSYNQTYFQYQIAPNDSSGYGYSHTDIPGYLIPVSLPSIPQRFYKF